MPNTFFKFKEFIIYQDKCAMKVCTDGCLFGSLLPSFSKGVRDRNVLDIGTGTGLLSLMFAQKNIDAKIDAIEIDENAAMQAAHNFRASPWSERLLLIQCDIRTISLNKKYDLIISNPPFYKNNLQSNDAKRNVALHSNELTFTELIIAVEKYLSENGSFVVLLPFTRVEEFINLVEEKKINIAERIDVKQSINHTFFRSILFFTKSISKPSYKTISIKEEKNEYTKEFKELLKPYYFYL